MDREPTHAPSSAHATLPKGHPWWGFAHPEHQDAELEGLVRTLRFASIQLGKFWVELNALPVFMNEMKGASLKQIERLFDSFTAAPEWQSRVRLPRLIPELCEPTSRRALLGFTSLVVRARALRLQSSGRMSVSLGQGPQEIAQAIDRLSGARAALEDLGIAQAAWSGLEERIAELAASAGRATRVQGFFASLAAEGGLGVEASDAAQAAHVFRAVDLARRAPLAAWDWRRPQILAAHNRTKIQQWQERARPLREAREWITPMFRTDQKVAAAQLRLLADKLRAGGWFKAFRSDYKDALARYRELLKLEPKAKPAKQTPQQMADALVGWAGYLERKAQLEESGEAKALFAAHFKGIDTDFEAALETNAWAQAARAELETEDKGPVADFTSRLCEALFFAPREKLLHAVELCSGAQMQSMQALLAAAPYKDGGEFAALGCEAEERWLKAERAKKLLVERGWRAEVGLGDLPAAIAAASELKHALEQMDAIPEAKAAFKPRYTGEQTELGWLADAQDYIDFVQEFAKASGLSDGLRASFLTAHGPQRLEDTRKGVAPALTNLGLVKEHFRRLAQATHGQSRQLEELPLHDMIQRISHALKSPGLLAGSVGDLRARSS